MTIELNTKLWQERLKVLQAKFDVRIDELANKENKTHADYAYLRSLKSRKKEHAEDMQAYIDDPNGYHAAHEPEVQSIWERRQEMGENFARVGKIFVGILTALFLLFMAAMCTMEYGRWRLGS